MPLPDELYAVDRDVIRNGIIYRADVVQPVGDPVGLVDETVWTNAREPIAQTFAKDGDAFTVVANHFKSRSPGAATGDNVDAGDGQGQWNGDRTRQAASLTAFSDRLRAATGEAMRVVGEVNKYLTVTEHYKMKDESQRERLATVLHVAAQCISDCNTLLSPFLPHSAQRVHEAFGRTGVLAAMPRIEEVDDLDGGPGYPVITGDYSDPAPWQRVPVVPGTPVPAPTPVFTKLDPSVVADELARMAGDTPQG